MTWDEIASAIRADESSRTIYVTQVFTDDERAPDLYLGLRSNGIVKRGEAAYILSSGEIVKL